MTRKELYNKVKYSVLAYNNNVWDISYPAQDMTNYIIDEDGRPDMKVGPSENTYIHFRRNYCEDGIDYPCLIETTYWYQDRKKTRHMLMLDLSRLKLNYENYNEEVSEEEYEFWMDEVRKMGERIIEARQSKMCEAYTECLINKDYNQIKELENKAGDQGLKFKKVSENPCGYQFFELVEK